MSSPRALFTAEAIDREDGRVVPPHRPTDLLLA